MSETPRDPIIRTVPQPADMNGNGDIFGGWVLSQMDIAGGTLASRVARGRVAVRPVRRLRCPVGRSIVHRTRRAT